MRISELKVNHVEKPMGFHMNEVVFQWKLEACGARTCVCTRLQVAEDELLEHIVYDSGEAQLDAAGTKADFTLKSSQRYYWQVMVRDDLDNCIKSEVSWFETSREEKQWLGKWIGAKEQKESTIIWKKFQITEKISKARLSVTGVGLYEVSINGEKAGDEYLTPGFNDYESFIQFQTYDVGQHLQKGENEIEICMGDGWYKGRYTSFGQGSNRNRYGDRQAALAELRIYYENGESSTVCTDHTWKSRMSPIKSAQLYDGEILDHTIADQEGETEEVVSIGYDRLQARRSLPVKIMERRKPVTLIHSPKGELILDFGQNMAGWVKVYNRLPRGEKWRYVAGEILQDSCFYHENMRTAKTEFLYTSDGRKEWIRPHFTYYGFRYLLLEGFPESVSLDDFEAEILYSDMEQTGFLETGNEKINRLISNVLWGQKSNYVDVPTDCPQRDERLGWTGDAQIFFMTGAYNMNVAAFFRKYMYDVYCEQKKNHGSVPFTVPGIVMENKYSAAWGDVATIIPWNMYMMYGNKAMLSEQYAGMKAWTDFIYGRDEKSGGSRLWKVDNHFGDWLSLDAPGNDPTGGTDMVLIATAYYYYSARLTARAAKVLLKEEDTAHYTQLAEDIKQSFLKEYMTEAGRLTEDTQTAHALVLYMDLYREGQEQRLVERLEELLLENHGFLNTGFVGTSFLCPVLSRFGKPELAYHLLLNEKYPGWLYCVNMGATTIWERWNSVLPDGRMNPEGMNSLNHYAYGSILEWVYGYVAGMRPLEAGWKIFYLAPQPDRRLGYLKGEYRSISGTIRSSWIYKDHNTVQYEMEVPPGTTAVLVLPGEEKVILNAGTYSFTREKAEAKKGYTGYTDMKVLLSDGQARRILKQYAPGLLHLPQQFAQGSLKQSMLTVFSDYSRMDFDVIDEKLREL